jgi:hypothetical protein
MNPTQPHLQHGFAWLGLTNVSGGQAARKLHTCVLQCLGGKRATHKAALLCVQLTPHDGSAACSMRSTESEQENLRHVT